MHCQFDALGRIAHLAAQPRSLRRGDLPDIIGALDQQDVGLAGFRERVRHAAANGTAPDDDDFGVGELVHHAPRITLFKYHRPKLSTLYSLNKEYGPGE